MSHLAHGKEDVNSLSATHASSSSIYNPALEKRVWRKLDLYVLPVVAMFYLLSFLVRHIVCVRLLVSMDFAGPVEHWKCSSRRSPKGPQND